MREAELISKALGRPVDGRELSVAGSELVEVLSALKNAGDFVLMDIDAVDHPEGYDLAYRLLDRGGEGQVGIFTVRVRIDKADPKLPSVMGVWKAADVLEREVWDLMGVSFEGRMGLKRILCKDDFEGHPLRKDFVVERTPRFAAREAGAAKGAQK
ncbi:MAG: NADH-quinone oxidoreductase subunit C [Rectinemataceae bacterium]